FDEITVIEIARKWTWWHRVVSTRLGTCDTEGAWKRADGNFDARSKFGYHTPDIDVKVFHLTVWELFRKLAEHTGNIEICAPWPRHDLLNFDEEGITWFGSIHVDRSCQGHRTTARPICPQLF